MLHIGIRGDEVCVCSKPALGEQPVLIDVDDVTRVVAREFGRRACDWLDSVTQSTTLKVYARDPGKDKIIFHSLKHVFMKTCAFSVLTAAEIARRLRRSSATDGPHGADHFGVEIALASLTELVPALEREFPRKRVRVSLSVHTAFSFWLKRLWRRAGHLLTVPGALAVCLVSLLLSILRREDVSRHRPVVVGDEMFAVHTAHSNSTIRVWDYIRQKPRTASSYPVTVLAVGVGLRPQSVPRDLDSRRVRLLRPARLIHFPAVALAVLKNRCAHLELFRALDDAGARIPLHQQLRIVLKLLRGLLHESWALSAAFSGRGVVVFGYSIESDTFLLELALQRRRLATVHWIHGTPGSTVGFYGVSDVVFCMSRVDAQTIRAIGDYGSYAWPTSRNCRSAASPAKSSGRHVDALIMTNLIHDVTPFPLAVSYDDLVFLLRCVADALGTGAGGRVVWRPHPHEVRNKACFPAAKALAEQLGFVVAPHRDLAEQIREARLVITTLSTTIRDATSVGTVPLVFVGHLHEDAPQWRAIPGEITFANVNELRALSDRMQDTSFVREAYAQLAQLYGNGASALPSPGYFAGISLHATPAERMPRFDG